MRKVIRIMRREYLEAVRKRSFLLGTLLVPGVMVAAIFLPIYLAKRTPEKSLVIAIADYSGAVRPRLIAALDDTLSDGRRRFRFSEVPIAGRTDEELRGELRSRVAAGRLDAFLIIPEDVLDDPRAEFYAGTVGVLGLEYRLRDALDKIVMRQRLLAEGVDAERLHPFMKGVRLKTLLVEESGEKESGFEQVYTAVTAGVMILFITIMVNGVSVMRSVLEEKSSRVIEIVLSSVSSMQLMVGKILGTGAVSLTQFAIWSVMGLLWVFLGIARGGGLVQLSEYISVGEIACMLLFALLGIVLFSTAYAALGAMCSTEQEAGQLQAPLTLFLLIPIFVAANIVQDPDGIIARVLSFVPFSAPILMFMRVTLSSLSPVEIGLSVASILASIFVMFWITARIFRVGLLMYGKRPNLPELIRWIRYA